MDILKGNNKACKRLNELLEIYNKAHRKGKDCKCREALLALKFITLFENSSNFKEVMEHYIYKQNDGHPLKGNRLGEYALSLNKSERFVVRLLGKYRLHDGNYDFTKVTVVELTEVGNYH